MCNLGEVLPQGYATTAYLMASVRHMAGNSVRLKSTVVQARSGSSLFQRTGHKHGADGCCAGDKSNGIAKQLNVNSRVWQNSFFILPN